MNIQSQMKDFISFFSQSGSDDRLKSDSQLEAADFARFGLNATLKHYQAGQLLISQGMPAPKLFFLTQGHVRYMSLSPEGKEFTQAFISAPSISGSTRAMSRKKDALFSIEALSDVLCLEFEWQPFFEQMKNQPGFLEAYNRLLETMFIKKEEREYAFVQHSAEQRYLTFLEENPKLRHQIPLKLIASYIGITPIALSRIRKRLK